MELLAQSVELFGIEVHAYCLMGNHYHLMLKTPDANLSRAMRHIDGIYTQRYNRSEQRDGPLFRGRYKAILIDADNYLIALSRYIHRNPVEAGICEYPSQYKWSSYRAYIGEISKPEWLSVNEILSFSGTPGVESYRELIENALEPAYYEYDLDSPCSPICGSKLFRASAMAKVSHLSKHPEIPQARPRIGRPVLSLVVEAVSQITGRKPTEMLSRRSGKNNHARSAVMFLAREKFGYPLNDVAKTFGISYSGVSLAVRRFKGTLAKEPALRQMVDRIAKTIADEIKCNVKT